MSKILKAYRENESGLRRYLSRFLSSKQDIDDSLQETFLKGFAAEMKTEILAPKAFLYRIARNVALFEIKRQRKNSTGATEDSDATEFLVDKAQPDAGAYIDGRRKLAILAKAVAELPPQCRRAFIMRRVEGLRYKQIANRMNISISSVEKHVASAVIKCNEYLLQQGLEPSEFGGGKKGKSIITTALKSEAERQQNDE